jgi:hypothetical protein
MKASEPRQPPPARIFLIAQSSAGLPARFCPSAEFLQYRYGSRGQTRPLRTRITRAFHLIAQAQNLSAKILYRLVILN